VAVIVPTRVFKRLFSGTVKVVSLRTGALFWTNSNAPISTFVPLTRGLRTISKGIASVMLLSPSKSRASAGREALLPALIAGEVLCKRKSSLMASTKRGSTFVPPNNPPCTILLVTVVLAKLLLVMAVPPFPQMMLLRTL